MYAYDTQLYICFNTQDTACAIAKLEKCMDEIEKWMVVNKLQLKGEKTDFVLTGSTSLLKKLNISTIKVGDSTVYSYKQMQTASLGTARRLILYTCHHM